MFYWCSRSNGKYGIIDTDDGMIEYYTGDEILSVLRQGVMIEGIMQGIDGTLVETGMSGEYNVSGSILYDLRSSAVLGEKVSKRKIKTKLYSYTDLVTGFYPTWDILFDSFILDIVKVNKGYVLILKRENAEDGSPLILVNGSGLHHLDFRGSYSKTRDCVVAKNSFKGLRDGFSEDDIHIRVYFDGLRYMECSFRWYDGVLYDCVVYGDSADMILDSMSGASDGGIACTLR